MTKEPLTHKLWAKVCAYFLLAIFACGLLASVIGVVFAWEYGVYTNDLDALKDTQLRDIARSAGDNVLRWVLWGSPEAAERQVAMKNAEYRVTDHTGAELWRSAGFDPEAGDGWRWAFAYRWVKRTLSNGDPYEYAEYMRSYDLEPENLEETDYVVEAELTSLSRYDEFYWTNRGFDLIWALRYAVYAVGLLCLAGFVACFVFLLCGAGHRAGHAELVPGYLYKVPFDLLTAALFFWIIGVVFYGDELMNRAGGDVFNILILFAATLCIVLPTAGWCASLAMRVKLGKWWRNTVIYFVLHLLWRGWRGFRRGAAALLRGLPLVWKTALGLAALTLLELFVLAITQYEWDNLMVCWVLEKLILIPAALWLALTLRKLQKGGEALAAGDLNYHTDTRRMLWEFKRHGENLNSIGVGMARVVDEQLRSERLKTELITNVSHDIKTPLTSIINYVDLLRRNDDPEKAREYLDVLDRQSHKLKKLTEDLVEVSKASTGNLEVNLSRRSAGELLHQVLGEYSERLWDAKVEAVLTLPETECFVLADGMLLWRVIDNLFSNVCKYALPGTRFYIDARESADGVRMSFKNISRDPLNVPADELMERFVRGDSARGGEGSGLGLNIARSLTEVQGGTFSLAVDGDLFKAEIVLPAAQ